MFPSAKQIDYETPLSPAFALGNSLRAFLLREVAYGQNIDRLESRLLHYITGAQLHFKNGFLSSMLRSTFFKGLKMRYKRMKRKINSRHFWRRWPEKTKLKTMSSLDRLFDKISGWCGRLLCRYVFDIDKFYTNQNLFYEEEKPEKPKVIIKEEAHWLMGQ